MTIAQPPFHVEPGWSGIFPDLPMSEYHRRELGIASAGAIKLARRSLAHYGHWARSTYERRSKAMDFGSKYHAYVLTPNLFTQDFVVIPANAPKRPTEKQRLAKSPQFATIAAMEWWDDFDAKHPGKQHVDAAETLKMADMRAALDDEDMVGELPKLMLTEGRREVSYRWVDPKTGIRCRARYDYELQDLHYGMDLKTCFDASPEGFAAAVVRNEYHVSQAHYLNGAMELGEPLQNYFFLAQETDPPYVAALYPIDEVGQDLGFSMWRRALDRLAAACIDGKFPGYGYDHDAGKHTIRPLSLPAYAFFKE